MIEVATEYARDALGRVLEMGYGEIAGVALASLWTAVRGSLDLTRMARWCASRLAGRPLAWCWRVAFPPDPLLDELRACLDGPHVTYDPKDGILCAEPLACKVDLNYAVQEANLAGKDVTEAMLGPVAWRRFGQAVWHRVHALECARLRSLEAVERERRMLAAQQARQQAQAEREAALAAARKARGPKAGQATYSGTVVRMNLDDLPRPASGPAGA